MFSKKYLWLFLFTSVVFLAFHLSIASLPVTLGEIYTISALNKIGINVDQTHLRLLTGFLSLVYIFLAFYLVGQFNKTRFVRWSAIVLIIITPLFVYVSSFKLELILAADMLLLSLILINIEKPLESVITSLISFMISPLSMLFFAYNAFRFLIKTRNYLVFVTLIAISFYSMVKFHPSFSLVEDTVIIKTLPVSLKHIIDKNLSFGKLNNSPLITENFNYHRLVLNKYFYASNEFFKSTAGSFDFEKYIFPLQNQIQHLPFYYFYQIPLALFGFVVLKEKNQKGGFLLVYLALGFATLIFFEVQESFIFTLPVIMYFLAEAANYIIRKSKLLFLFMIIVTASEVILFFDLFNYHPKLWYPGNAYVYKSIFTALNDNKYLGYKLYLTDRLGNPNVIYDYYLQYDFTNSQPFENVNFGSFNYSSTDVQPNSVWVGFPSEFLEANVSLSDSNLKGGSVQRKIDGISGVDTKTLGDELWIVTP